MNRHSGPTESVMVSPNLVNTTRTNTMMGSEAMEKQIMAQIKEVQKTVTGETKEVDIDDCGFSPPPPQQRKFRRPSSASIRRINCTEAGFPILKGCPASPTSSENSRKTTSSQNSKSSRRTLNSHSSRHSFTSQTSRKTTATSNTNNTTLEELRAKSNITLPCQPPLFASLSKQYRRNPSTHTTATVTTASSSVVTETINGEDDASLVSFESKEVTAINDDASRVSRLSSLTSPTMNTTRKQESKRQLQQQLLLQQQQQQQQLLQSPKPKVIYAEASTQTSSTEMSVASVETNTVSTGVQVGGDMGTSTLEEASLIKDESASSILQLVEGTQRWLFLEAGHLSSVEEFICKYCEHMRDLGIPVDRVVYGGLGLHVKLTLYFFKWTHGEPFVAREMPKEIFERRHELIAPDEPFVRLEFDREPFVRIRNTDESIPSDTAEWFRGGNYVDYYALPDMHGDEFRGCFAWATKTEGGFTEDQIAFLNQTLPALNAVMRLHHNDLVLQTVAERMEQEIQDRTEELIEANLQLEIQAKKQMEHFACMSHEIRTPLNCIVGLSSLLIDTSGDSDDDDGSEEALPASVLESIQMIHSSADLLNAVVDDVLDYAKMESGVFDVNICPTNLQDTFTSVVHAMKEKALKTNVTISTNYSPILPDMMETDPRRLQQVLYNLLGNACKFSKPGGIVELKVWLEEATKINPVSGEVEYTGMRNMKIAVKDYGNGIAEEDFESIFEPFNQASKETQTIYGGTGLGLSITSKLIERLGGSIGVDSVLGEYAEFVVDLPYSGTSVDVTRIEEKLQETTIIFFQPNKMAACPRFEQNPLRKEVTDTYNLDVLTVSSWKEMNRILDDDINEILSANESVTRFWNKDHEYLVVVPLMEYDAAKYEEFAKEAGRSQLITYGLPSFDVTTSKKIPSNSKVHWSCLMRTFPYVVVSKLSSLVASPEARERRKKPVFKKKTAVGKVQMRRASSVGTTRTSVGSMAKPNISRRSSLQTSSHTTNSQNSSPQSPHPIQVIQLPSPKRPMSTGNMKRCLSSETTRSTRSTRSSRSSKSDRKPTPLLPRDTPKAPRLSPKDSVKSKVSIKVEKPPSPPKESPSVKNSPAMKKSPLTEGSPKIKQSPPTTKQSPAPKQSPTSNPGKGPRSLKILYAEDNKINQKVLNRMITKLGIRDMDIVDNGKKAVDKSAEVKYDIIFMDMEMPIMGGLEATTVIKKRDGPKNSPQIIFCTAHAVEDFRNQAAESGGDSFISKPFNLKRIEGVLDEVSQLKQTQNS